MNNILLGLVLSTSSAFLFAVSNMFITRGMTVTTKSSSVFTTVLFSSLMIFIVTLLSGEFFSFGTMALSTVLLFMLAGVCNFILGRGLNYAGIVILGPSRGSAITSSQSLFAVLFGVLLIAEPLTTLAVIGVLLSFLGTVLVTIGGNSGKKLDSRGLIYSLVAAVFVGLAVVVIRAATLQSPLPIDGALLSYLTAGLFYFILNLIRARSITKMFTGTRVKLLAAAGSISGLAQSARFVALLVSPIVLVAPITTANPLFTMLLSFVTMRGKESLTFRLIVGALLIIIGVAVISSSLGI